MALGDEQIIPVLSDEKGPSCLVNFCVSSVFFGSTYWNETCMRLRSASNVSTNCNPSGVFSI